MGPHTADDHDDHGVRSSTRVRGVAVAPDHLGARSNAWSGSNALKCSSNWMLLVETPCKTALQ